MGGAEIGKEMDRDRIESRIH